MEQFIFEDRNLSVLQNGKSVLIIDGDEHFHLSRVLRVKVGDRILATNGDGATCLCVVTVIEKSRSVCEVVQKYDGLNSSVRKYCIGMAFLKPMSKMELAVEKCTELGASRFVLFNTERSEKVNPRPERLQGIIKSAVKQSLQSRFPELSIVEDLEKLVAGNLNFEEKIVLHERAGEVMDMGSLLSSGGKSVIALIGPEGGFSENEIAFLKENGYRSFSLGKARLRSGTAAIKVSSLLAVY
ncbi:MAG: 16S rRNA (uracil(1498)-N(3))-methyltransferase [Bacteroidetes bacterium]|nr:16S rRNA (uracil(1498)-N(3))-methyltransferase [Bacteroidota bacterium]